MKVVLLVLLVLLVVAVVTAVRRRGPAVPGAARGKAATDQAVIARQGHNQGFSGGGGGA